MKLNYLKMHSLIRLLKASVYKLQKELISIQLLICQSYLRPILILLFLQMFILLP